MNGQPIVETYICLYELRIHGIDVYPLATGGGETLEVVRELIGLAHFLFHRSTIQQGPSCYLQDLFTVEGARGKGVGRKLIEEVYRVAQTSGVERVYWHTRESSTTAMQLYDKVAEKQGSVVYRKPL